jgi:hypothetical protein
MHKRKTTSLYYFLFIVPDSTTMLTEEYEGEIAVVSL